MSTSHDSRSTGAEQQAWWGEAFAAFIATGGEPVVPSSSTTLDAFATAGYTIESGKMAYVSQASHVVGPLISGNGTYWLALHKDLTGVVFGWTRQPLTHYLWQQNGTQPDDPPGGIVFARVTMSGGVVTEVTNFKRQRPASLLHSTGWVSTKDTNGDINQAIILAARSFPTREGGVVVIEPGEYNVTSPVILPSRITLWAYGAHINAQGAYPALVTGTYNSANDTLTSNIGDAPAAGTDVNFAAVYGGDWNGVASTPIAIDINLMTRRGVLRDLYSDVDISSSGTVLNVNNSFTLLIENFYASMSTPNTRKGIEINTNCFKVDLIHCKTFNGDIGLHVQTNTCTIRGCNVEFAATVGIKLNNAQNVHIESCHFEGNTWDVHAGQTGSAIQNLRMDDCWSLGATNGVQLQECVRGRFSNNRFQDLTNTNRRYHVTDSASVGNIFEIAGGDFTGSVPSDFGIAERNYTLFYNDDLNSEFRTEFFNDDVYVGGIWAAQGGGEISRDDLSGVSTPARCNDLCHWGNGWTTSWFH